MTPVYLGFIDTLQEILQKVFHDVLAPVLTSVFNTLLNMLLNVLEEAFADILLDGLLGLLNLVHYMVKLFDVFSGSAEILYQNEKMTVLEMMFGMNGISKAFFLITLIAGVFAFVFAIVQTARSISGSALDGDYKPVSKVLQDGIKSMLSFILVPVLCMVMLELSNIVLAQIETVFEASDGSAGRLGVDDIIFNSVAGTAQKDKGNAKKPQQYSDRGWVEKHYDIGKLDYVTGYVSSLFVMLILLGTGLMFIRRCFDLLVLYFVSPFFSATIALDGGGRFVKWREQFVGRFFAAFGSVLAMRLYLMVIPYFSNGMIQYSADSTLNSFMKLFILIGGAWAVYKGNSTVSQLLFHQSQQEGMLAAMGIAHMMGRKARSLFRRG